LIFIFHFWKKKINSQLFKKTGGGWTTLFFSREKKE